MNNTHQAGILYVVATPIGNLADMTFRAVDILKNVDLILCEDTRTSHTLLKHYGITTKTSSYHAHSTTHKHDSITSMLLDGKNIALISDAGTPGISDPGSLLISTIRDTEPNILIIPIPGANAIGALVSVSGSMGNEFTFLGFIPHKKGRETFFKSLINYAHPVVFYESCHRIIKTLESLRMYQDSHMLFLGREMTKKFETYLYSDIQSIHSIIISKSTNLKGEFTLMLIPRKK